VNGITPIGGGVAASLGLGAEVNGTQLLAIQPS
jgi:hypothetical protein